MKQLQVFINYFISGERGWPLFSMKTIYIARFLVKQNLIFQSIQGGLLNYNIISHRFGMCQTIDICL